MGNVLWFTLFYSFLLFLHQGMSLHCRTGNQQTDMDFQKVLKKCKNRYSDLNLSNVEDTSMEDSNFKSESMSEENTYDENFSNKNRDKYSSNQSMNNQGYQNIGRKDNMDSLGSMNGNIKDFQVVKHFHEGNHQGSWNMDNSHNKRNNSNNNTDHEQACIIQCFFNELNVVDQKGFPERGPVIQLMSQNIQDTELKDFVEESITDCFHYLESSNRDKCQFSQMLLSCLAEKGKAKCEDWDG